MVNSVQSTLTFPPITVTEFALSAMIIPASQAQLNNKRAAIDAQVTTTLKLSTTTAWPQSTWTDDLGQTYSTRPTGATLNFPPRDYQLSYMPTLHVRNGVPSSTVSKCAFPALSCPTSESSSLGNALWGSLTKRPMRKGPSPDDIQLHLWEGPLGIPDVEEAEPEQCNTRQEEQEDDNQEDSGEPDVPEPGAEPPVVLPPTGPIPILPPVLLPVPWLVSSIFPSISRMTRTLIPPTERPHPTKTGPFETPVPAMETAVFPKDPKPHYYNKGISGDRASLGKVIDSFCNRLDFSLSIHKQMDLEPGTSTHVLRENSTNPYIEDLIYIDFIVRIEIKEGCLWKNFDFYECARQFKYIVDKCDTKGENNKHGGTLEGNCVN